MTARSNRAHRNVALASGLAVVLGLMVAHVPGMSDGLAYLGPCLFVYLLLRHGRYPGEKAILAFISPSQRRRTQANRQRCCPLRVNMPRGGALLAAALAGRAPPPDARLNREAIEACPELAGHGPLQLVTQLRRNVIMKAKRIALAVLAALVVAPASAQAHISLHPNTVPAGAFATLDVRVPGEQEGAYVKKVDVLFPAGFTSVDYEDHPGWSTHVIETKLATPIREGGETIDTEVSQIVWTWIGPLGKVDNAQFIDFPLSLAIPEGAAGKTLEFRTVQTYSNGQIVHWIEPSLTAEHPAPRINVTAKGGVIEDVAGHEAGPEAGQTGSGEVTPAAPSTAVAKSSSGASKGLGIAALILGAFGLIAGLAALATSRRTKATP
jgi:uncharacterized protein YcnI